MLQIWNKKNIFAVMKDILKALFLKKNANAINNAFNSINLIRFFRNEQADVEGRMLYDILQYTSVDLEFYHDFIQWIFPTIEKSAFNVYAPVIDETFKEEFQNDKLAKQNFCKSCQLYLSYIGFQCNRDNIICNPNPYIFDELPAHNLLRITRVLSSLNQVGNTSCSSQLYKALMKEVKKRPYKVNEITLQYWKETQKNH